MELKPCPYCGGEAEMIITRHVPHGQEYTPRCKDTKCAGRLTKNGYRKKQLLQHGTGGTVNMWEIKRAIREGLETVGRVFLWIFTLTSMVSPIAIAGITENWKWAWLLIVSIPFFGGFGGWFIDHS